MSLGKKSAGERTRQGLYCVCMYVCVFPSIYFKIKHYYYCFNSEINGDRGSWLDLVVFTKHADFFFDRTGQNNYSPVAEKRFWDLINLNHIKSSKCVYIRQANTMESMRRKDKREEAMDRRTTIGKADKRWKSGRMLRVEITLTLSAHCERVCFLFIFNSPAHS